MIKKTIAIACVYLFAIFSGVDTIQAQGEDFDERVGQIIETYLNVKDALVTDEEQLAGAWAERLETILATTAEDAAGEEYEDEWADIQHGLLASAGDIFDAESIEGKREAFIPLSNSMKELADQFGTAGHQLYVQSCPMVNGETEIWLSNSDRVLNPYHGAEMQDCGSVEEEL